MQIAFAKRERRVKGMIPILNNGKTPVLGSFIGLVAVVFVSSGLIIGLVRAFQVLCGMLERLQACWCLVWLYLRLLWFALYSYLRYRYDLAKGLRCAIARLLFYVLRTV